METAVLLLYKTGIKIIPKHYSKILQQGFLQHQKQFLNINIRLQLIQTLKEKAIFINNLKPPVTYSLKPHLHAIVNFTAIRILSFSNICTLSFGYTFSLMSLPVLFFGCTLKHRIVVCTVAKCETLQLDSNGILSSSMLQEVIDKQRYQQSSWYSFKELLFLNLRAAHLFIVFFPLLLIYPLTYVSPKCFNIWISLLYIGVERSGATFIKLGQWASTRRDLFSRDFCDKFSGLHHQVQPHAWSHTEKALHGAYGSNWQNLLHLDRNQKPVGSGCIAQVYKGYVSRDFVPTSNSRHETSSTDLGSVTGSKCDKVLNNASAAVENLVPVAIKILHPNIVQTFQRDLRLMAITAKYLTLMFPKLHWVNLKQCVEEFALTMCKQLDMRHEYQSLQRFSNDFALCASIRVPQPVAALLRRDILVETFEEGVSVGHILKDTKYSSELKKHLATIGMDALLQMVFVNNFVHGDLHPGNLLVQNLDHFVDEANGQGGFIDKMIASMQPKEENPLRLVLLDCGITASLTANDRQKFMEVFIAVVKGEGEVVADLFLSKSAVNHCTNPELFRKEMAAVVDRGCHNLMRSKLKIAELMNDVFSLLSRHRIQLEASFATIILAIAMLEGLGKSLDPNLDILAKARTVLLGAAIRGT